MINNDPRFINNGIEIPTAGGYADQPSIVALSDGTFVCATTTGTGEEGAKGQYVSVMRSTDGGRSWSEGTLVEDPAWESAYAVLVADRFDRIYCLYNYNLDHYKISEFDCHRLDMGGTYCMRYSDDKGLSWSERILVDVGITALDRQYPYFPGDGSKQYRFMWNVARPFIHGDDLYIMVGKPFLGIKKLYGNLETSRGVLLVARGIVQDPHAPFVTLPEGGRELLPRPGDRITEEHCCVRLSDGTLFVTSRTESGYPLVFVSHDDGRSFTDGFLPQHIGGQTVKQPRAANFLWKLKNGRYLYWFHNAGNMGYDFRMPAWCCPAFETDTPAGKELVYGQPEILFYHTGDRLSISYPDLIEHEGRLLITETQKQVARIHTVSRRLQDALLHQDTVCARLAGISMDELAHSGMPAQQYSKVNHSDREEWKEIPVDSGTAWLVEGCFEKSGSVFCAYDRRRGGFRMNVTEDGTLCCFAAGEAANFTLESSIPVCDGKKHHIAWITDAAACISYLVIDGIFDNGGAVYECGWRFVPRQLSCFRAVTEVRFGKGVSNVRLIPHAILTADAIGDWRAGM
ncbi:MAG: exo-alpha-sialidase [Oscillospiraceae bacterium]|nr:exo-alpha-sialidase [Oscillospiraceae bacterium]